jgi:hypothetical protein
MGWGTYALWISRILFACRVSLLSVLAGTLLFLMSTQARDLFADVTFGALPGAFDAWGVWLWFFACLVFVWAFPVHYAARRMLYADVWMFSCRIRAEIDPRKAIEVKQDMKRSIDWIPRLLAAVPFAAVLIGLWKAHGVVAETMALEPAQAASSQILVLVWVDIVIALVFLAFLWSRRILTRRMSNHVGKALAIAYVVVITALFVASVAKPFFPADIAPRAATVPLLMGGFVFLGTYLAWLAHRYCVPVLALSVVAALWVTGLNVHFNDVRTLPSGSDDFSQRQIDIGDAIEKWKAANCDMVAHLCPPAVIVAAEGGASRAAFAAATAVGELLDHANHLPDASDPTRAIAPARRIFAISGVSGGSFGAATIRTALADSLERGQSGPPCLRPPPGFFGAATADVTTSWRACLQALVSGDYLSPAFVGLAFRDNFSPPNGSGGSLLFSDDRAALVERAWERHYDQVVRGEIPGFFAQLAQDLAAPTERRSGLRDRFGFLSDKLAKLKGDWLPVLMLNGTSVGTGARVIASDLISTRATRGNDGNPAHGRFSIYPAAFDVFEMLAKPCPTKSVDGNSCDAAHNGTTDLPNARAGADIRLSTAAMLSARFPIISPAGILRASGDDKTGDRIVDGGYFENAGLTTAMDVARELRRLGVVPVVLWVQNGPRTDAGDPVPPDAPPLASDSLVPPRGAGTPELGSADPSGIEKIFGVVVTPVVALTVTRDGHGAEEAADAQRELWLLNRDVEPQDPKVIGSSYFMFGMFQNPKFSSDPGHPSPRGVCAKLAADWRIGADQMSEVSMSWWLSQSVQAELDSQICDQRNRRTLADLDKRLSQRCPIKPLDPSSGESAPAPPEGSPQRCEP